VAAVAIANAIDFFLNFTFAYAVVDGPRYDRWFVPRLAAAFGYLLLVLLLVDHFLPASYVNLGFDAASAMMKWLVALLALVPLFLVAERQLSLVTTFRGFVIARVGGVRAR
jgi:hypothetical protein